MTRAEMKQLAKEKLKGNWGVAIVALLVVGIITSALSFTAIGSLLVLGPLSFGLCFVYLAIIRSDKKPEFSDIFKGFNTFFNNFIVGLLITLYTFLWSLLFIIPGIIAKYAYSMAFYIQNDHPEMSENEAIKASKELMNGHKWDLFILDLSFIGWYLLCGLTFGILCFYVMPYVQATRAAFYEDLIAQQKPAATYAGEAQHEEPAKTVEEAQPEVEDEIEAQENQEDQQAEDNDQQPDQE